jgi:glycosyltransferase involved in cell wall biosynthesis
MVTRNNSALQVVHLSTSHTGGAGIAARRLNQELNSQDFSSVFYAIKRKDYTPTANEYVIERSLLTRIRSLPALWLAKYLSNFSFFSLMSTSAISSSWLKSLNSNGTTILHIHNWFNLLSNRQLASLVKSGVPIVITMHDQRMMTGGCHYASNCKEFYAGCQSCPITPKILSPIPKRNAKHLHSAFRAISAKVKVVAPSQYLMGEAHKSFNLKKLEVLHIPNVLPVNYALESQRDIKVKPTQHSYRVGIASMNPFDFIKGGDVIEELISSPLLSLQNISFLMLADFGHERYPEFWNSIDCLLVPSRADNSPNVIHEAKAFGIPIIGSDAGGIPELLSPLVDVIIPVSDLSSESILKAIVFTQQRKLSEEDFLVSRKVFKDYTEGAIDKLVNIYSEILIGE